MGSLLKLWLVYERRVIILYGAVKKTGHK